MFPPRTVKTHTPSTTHISASSCAACSLGHGAEGALGPPKRLMVSWHQTGLGGPTGEKRSRGSRGPSQWKQQKKLQQLSQPETGWLPRSCFVKLHEICTCSIKNKHMQDSYGFALFQKWRKLDVMKWRFEMEFHTILGKMNISFDHFWSRFPGAASLPRSQKRTLWGLERFLRISIWRLKSGAVHLAKYCQKNPAFNGMDGQTLCPKVLRSRHLWHEMLNFLLTGLKTTKSTSANQQKNRWPLPKYPPGN